MEIRIAKIALYGGSFDPIHNGHLIHARKAMVFFHLNAIVFLPARISPHKLDKPPTDGAIRAEMIAVAIAEDTNFVLDERELRREGPSYAIDTVREFRAEFPNTQLYYIIGEDSLAELPTWREYDALCKLVKFIVLPRFRKHAPKSWPNDAHFIMPHPSQIIKISSTDIRARVTAGLPIDDLVPSTVAEIIQKHHLYQK